MKKQLTVIIAENDSNAERTLNLSLQVHKEWKLFAAMDADDVYKLVRRDDIDALVLESLFPGLALKVLYKLRSNPMTAHLPVLAVTGNMGPQSKEMLSCGANRCIEQPVSGRSLTAALREMVQEAKPPLLAPTSTIHDPQRISALEATGMLDFAPSEEFGDITRLAARILGVPVALVSLVDKDRQYFLCQHGLVEPWASQRETPLSHSFCQWVVASKEPLVVNDAREHKLLAQNKAVEALGVTAYVGQPIWSDDEQLIGSFCGIDAHPRSWTYNELATMTDLAKLIETYIFFEKQSVNTERSNSNNSSHSNAETQSASKAATKGISAATRLLGRSGMPLSSSERQSLGDIIQTLTEKQLALAPD